MKITNQNQIDDYYRALVNREKSYVGSFFVGVKTTNIFCIATCRARKPKPENVEFFTEMKDALTNGYRPCKVCRPTENADEAPKQILDALQLVSQRPKQKITDQELQMHDIQPEYVRRWFKKHYGMTFQGYQRLFRINEAYNELQSGTSTTSTAFKSGFESLSGFGYTYKKAFGESPSKSKSKNVILIKRFTTPLGPMFACATENGLCLLEFVDRRMLETEFQDLQKRLNAVILTGQNQYIEQAIREIGEYFDGKRITFNVPLITPGTEFQRKVWDELKQIPYGQTCSYREQANTIGNPKAVRAVASANGHNRIAIIIPCHRVIGSNGELTGYAGGLERKRWLLKHESSYVS